MSIDRVRMPRKYISSRQGEFWVVETDISSFDQPYNKAIFSGPHASRHADIFAAAVYEGIYPHVHMAGEGADIDTCRRCGKDIRDGIHAGQR